MNYRTVVLICRDVIVPFRAVFANEQGSDRLTEMEALPREDEITLNCCVHLHDVIRPFGASAHNFIHKSLGGRTAVR